MMSGKENQTKIALNPENGFIRSYRFNDGRVQRAFQYFLGLSKNIKPLFVCKEIYKSGIKNKLNNIIKCQK